MATLPAPLTKHFPEDSVEKQCYNIVEQFKENIPIPNDRARLGFCLVKFVQGEGDPPEILVKSTKIKLEGILEKDLAEKLTKELENIKK